VKLTQPDALFAPAYPQNDVILSGAKNLSVAQIPITLLAISQGVAASAATSAVQNETGFSR
jgi:hypothetical protein